MMGVMMLVTFLFSININSEGNSAYGQTPSPSGGPITKQPDTTSEPGGTVTTPPDTTTGPGGVETVAPEIEPSIPTHCAPGITTRTPTSIAVDTDQTTYTPGQVAKLYIFVTDITGCPINTDVTVTVTNPDKPKAGVLYQQTFPINGTYNRNFGVTLEQVGRHNITAKVTGILLHPYPVSEAEAAAFAKPMSAMTIIEVKELTQTRAAFVFYIGLASFAGLMITIALGYTNTTTGQILRFIFISGIIFAVVGSFTFVNQEISGNSPIGLIKKPPISGEWMVNIGGNPRTNYEDGIQIPINVIIFGIAGGYLRYLYETANFIKNNKELLEDAPKTDAEKRINKLRNFYQSLEDIALLFLAPLLAIAVYFLLTVFGLEGSNAVYVIAVISFSVGLVTEEVVQALIRFTTSRLKVEKSRQSVPESSAVTSS